MKQMKEPIYKKVINNKDYKKLELQEPQQLPLRYTREKKREGEGTSYFMP